MGNSDFFDELEKALTPGVRRKLLKYALVRCKMLALVGIAVDSSLAEHLAWDAISDTASGKMSWDPNRCSLSWHLRRVVQNRTLWMFRRQLKRPHLPIQPSGADSDDEENRRVENEASRLVNAEKLDPESVAIARDIVTQVTDRLYDLARSDEDVVLLLMAYEEGVTNRSGVVELSGMTEKAHDNAKKRLKRLLKKLPEILNSDARSVMGDRR